MCSVGVWVEWVELDTADSSTVTDVGNLHVSLVSPGGSPGVSEDVVVLTVLGSVSNEGDGVIEGGSARGGVEDTGLVELEDSLVSLNGDGDWLLGNGGLGLGGGSWGGVHVGGDLNSGLLEGIVLAVTVLGSVWVGRSEDGVVLLVVVEGVLLESTIASKVSP